MLGAAGCMQLGGHLLTVLLRWCPLLTHCVCGCVPQLEVDSRPEAFSEVEKVVPKLLAAIDDAHFKVGGTADPWGSGVRTLALNRTNLNNLACILVGRAMMACVWVS